MESKIQTIVSNRKANYTKSLRTFESWSTKKCSMNGTSDKYIRTMLVQMLKELNIPSTKANSVINALFKRDFGADKLVNNVWKNPGVFDIINKDAVIRSTTIENYLKALKESGLHMTGYNEVQLAGLCVFTQFILAGGRTELEGFGISDNQHIKKLIDRDIILENGETPITESRIKRIMNTLPADTPWWLRPMRALPRRGFAL